MYGPRENLLTHSKLYVSPIEILTDSSGFIDGCLGFTQGFSVEYFVTKHNSFTSM